MKKRIMIAIIVVVLLVLFLPIPKGTCQDGGTRDYCALTYRIVVWNKLMVKENEDGSAREAYTYHNTSVFWIPDNFKNIDELWKIERGTGTADTDVLCIMADGSFLMTNSGEYTAEELIEAGVRQAFSFGPALVRDGAVSVRADQEVGRAMASNPRTAIGMIDPLHYVFVTADGRTSESEGLSLSELAAFMQRLGVRNAYNLDGGGSTTMYFNGEIINNPTTNGRSIKERKVSDIVYIGY